MTLAGSLIGEDDLVVFLGAGASHDSGLDLGDDASARLVMGLFEVLGLEHPMPEGSGKWPRLEVVVDFLEKHVPTAALSIVRTFAGVGLASTHKILARRSQPGWLWLTTNFDDQIERANREIAQRLLSVVVNREEIVELAAANRTSNILVKLHGDSNTRNPDELGATIHQILRTFRREAVKSIAAIARGRPLMFIGYSARDRDLWPLVGSLITGASEVVWIGLRPLEKLSLDQRSRLGVLFSLNKNSMYVSGGANHVLESDASSKTEPDQVPGGEWMMRVNDWMKAQPERGLSLALAEICSFVGSKALLETVLAHVPRPEGWDPARLEIELRHLCQTGKTRDAEQLADRHQRLVGVLEGDEKLRAASILGLAYHRIGAYSKAISLLKPGLDERTGLSMARDTAELATATFTLGLAQIYAGGEDQFHTGLANLQRAVAIAQGCNDKVLESAARLRLSIGLMRRGEYADAIKELDEVQEIEEDIGDPRGVIDAKANYAEALRRSGQTRRALEINEEVLASADPLSDEEVRINVLQNKALCQIALDRDPFPTADATLSQIPELPAAGSQGEVLPNALTNRGYLRVCAGRWKEAMPYLIRATNAYLDRGSKEGAAYALSLLGWAQFRHGDLGEARATYQRIQNERLISQGEHGVDLRMLAYALEHHPALNEQTLHEIETLFERDHEQRFHLLLFILESGREESDHELTRKAVASAYEAARNSGVKIFEKVLGDALPSTLPSAGS